MNEEPQWPLPILILFQVALWGTRVLIPVAAGVIVFFILDDQPFNDRVADAFGAWLLIWVLMGIRHFTNKREE